MRKRTPWRRCLLPLALACVLTLTLSRATRAQVAGEPAGASDAGPQLSLPAVVIAPGAEVVLDLRLTDHAGNVRGVDLTLAYTATVVELVSITKGPLAADWLLLSNVRPNGLVDLGLAGVTPPAGDVTLAQLTFRGIGQKGQTSALAFQRALVNEVDVSADAVAGQITLDTPPVTDLGAGVVSSTLRLTWTHVGSDADHYEVWRATNLPYFAPPAGTLIAPNVAPTAHPSYDDGASGLGNPAANSFYLVRSVDAAGRPAPTYNRVGVFSFGLTAGSP